MKTTNDNSTVVLYLRVSSDEQAHGFSLDYQEESMRKFCEMKGYSIAAVYREDHSAKNFKRPEWAKLQAYVKANKRNTDKVLLSKWDRFSRNVHKAFDIINVFDDMGIEINAVEQWLEPENPDRIVLLSFYLSIAEAERKKIASRTKDGTYQAKREGYYASRAPYGYDSHRNGVKSERNVAKGKRALLIPNGEAQFVTRAFAEVAKNLEPLETIRKRLCKEGMQMSKSSFSEMLKNIIYAGKVIVPEYKKESAYIVDGKHKALIDLHTFNKVQEVFRKSRWHGLKPKHRNEDFPLRDFLTCEHCGRQIMGSKSKGRSKYYSYYHCRGNCETRVSLEKTHEHFAGLLRGYTVNQNVKSCFADILRDTDAQINGNRESTLTTLSEKKLTLKSNLEKADDLYIERKLPAERYHALIERYKSELTAAEMEIESINGSNESILEYVDAGLELLSSLDQLFLEADYDGKRILAGSLLSGKLLFGNEGCRTAEVNQVVELLSRNGAGLRRMEKRKAAISDSFSAKVPGAGLEPARFPTGV